MENPYESPQESVEQSGDTSPAHISPGNGMTSQVRIVCILMWVQGGLELINGIFFIGAGFFMSAFFRVMAESNSNFGNNAGGPPPEFLEWMVRGSYIAMGISALLGAALHIYAGFLNFSFRSRTFGVVALYAWSMFGLLMLLSANHGSFGHLWFNRLSQP